MSLIFVVTAVAEVGVGVAVCLNTDAAHPVLAEPWVVDVVEDVGVGQPGLVGVADGATAVAEDVVVVTGFLKGFIELGGERLMATHEPGKTGNVV